MKQYWCRLPVPSWASKGPSVRLIHMEDDQEKEIQGQMIQGHHADAVLHRFKCCFRNKWGHIQYIKYICLISWNTKDRTLQMCSQYWKLNSCIEGKKAQELNVFRLQIILFFFFRIKCFSCITTVWCVDLFSLLVGDLCQRGLCPSRNPTSQDLLKYVKIKAETIYSASHFN